MSHTSPYELRSRPHVLRNVMDTEAEQTTESTAAHAAPAEMNGRPGPRQAALRYAARLAFELIIVFAGVTAAFLLENYRQGQEERERAREVYAALASNLENFVTYTPSVIQTMNQRLAAFSEARDAGEQPAPAYYREPRAEGPPITVWQASQRSGSMNLMDVELFYDLANFYNRVGSLTERYKRYNRFTEQQVLPFVKQPTDAFYDENGELQGPYRAHMNRLREIRDELRRLSDEARTLRKRLQQELRGLG